jgi:hypothetical protein
MSGGGSDKKKDSGGPAIGSPSPNLPPAVTMQPMMPGFQNMLAEQLAGGFSGQVGAPDFAAMLSQMYSPITMVGPTKTTPSKTTSSGKPRTVHDLTPEEIKELYPKSYEKYFGWRD